MMDQNEEVKLRKFIQVNLQKEYERNKKSLMEKKSDLLQIRKIIAKKILNESGAGAEMLNNTGINVLADLLKKIVPIFDQDFKLLTTSYDQRKSYRAHVIRAVVDALLPSKIEMSTADKIDNKDAPPSQVAQIPQSHFGQEQKTSSSLSNPEEDVDINIFEQSTPSETRRYDPDPKYANKFISIDKNAKDGKSLDEEEKEEDRFGIQGYDTTGRNIALKSWKKVEKTVIDAYNLLSNKTDRRMFFDYLITNLKLYFDRFEADLSPMVNEPTTEEYEQTKGIKSQYSISEGSRRKIIPETKLLRTAYLDNYYLSNFIKTSVSLQMMKRV